MPAFAGMTNKSGLLQVWLVWCLLRMAFQYPKIQAFCHCFEGLFH